MKQALTLFTSFFICVLSLFSFSPDRMITNDNTLNVEYFKQLIEEKNYEDLSQYFDTLDALQIDYDEKTFIKMINIIFNSEIGPDLISYFFEKGMGLSELLFALDYEKNLSVERLLDVYFISIDELFITAVQENISSVLIEEIINYNPNVNYRDIDGMTPLHYAAYNSNIKTVNDLLVRNANVKARNKKGETPLMLACMNYTPNTLSIIKSLVENKSEIESKDNELFTPLFIAAMYCDLDTIKYLISCGANPYAKNIRGSTLLMSASEMNENEDVIDFLIELGIDINYTNVNYHNALLLASLNNENEKIVEKLINQKADINSRDINGRTPIIMSVRGNKLKNTNVILRYHPDLTIVDTSNKDIIAYLEDNVEYDKKTIYWEILEMKKDQESANDNFILIEDWNIVKLNENKYMNNRVKVKLKYVNVLSNKKLNFLEIDSCSYDEKLIPEILKLESFKEYWVFGTVIQGYFSPTLKLDTIILF